ncbi:4Fe-4S dicluster domain-containing protein [Sulfurimonas paralvinellae]|uniref:4Fe-4S dicluster domain-containing protein n=1 Tax=Sulfurimonas paralvinellae TaxID=317658 RepID=A0A7M1B934_9BACT|nr:4Fe-4S dicluster domain-containing protein [Sulfurimonas paralvinellae]QOP46185.1 4Fe-4S dicluster domain-containing protein [Sulfurimonas paralvinellae]
MSLLSLDVSKCVHTSNKFAICNKCVEVCPVETIKITEGVVSFVPSECVGCGGCGAVCPTAAYSLDDFKPINYVFSFLENDEQLISCKTELPCIAALSAEELLSMALIANEQLTADIGGCKNCEIGAKNLPIIEERIEEVNFLLEAMQQNKSILLQEVESVSEPSSGEALMSRRELLSKEGLKKAVSIKQQFENEVAASEDIEKVHTVTNADIAKIKQKNIPDRRSLLLMAMKRASVPEIFHNIDINDISFISQKDLDETTCTNCQMCYRICPTGALSSDGKNSVINFNPLACVQCHSCHDVCEPDSLTLRPTFALESFFEPKIETLARFSIKRCDECGNFFAYKGGEVLCQRCKIEEEEARELWGIK